MKVLIYTAAVVAALATVLSTRLLIPAAVLVFKAIEATFEPQEPELIPALAVVAEPAPAPKKPRAARRRKPSKQLLAKVEAIA